MNTLFFLGYLVIALLFVLIQIFLSLRPGKIWGLVLPAGFLLLVGMSVLNCLPEVMGITYNEVARRIYIIVGLLGIAVFLVIYALGRLRVQAREAERRRRYEAYLEAKRARERQAAGNRY